MRRKYYMTQVLSVPLIVLGLLAAVPAAGEAESARTRRVRDPNGESVVVARIGEYRITRKDLEEQLQQDIRPDGYEEVVDDEPVTVEGTLRDMVAEKAMIIEGRKLGYQDDEMIQASMKRFSEQQLTRALLNDYVGDHMPPAPEAAAIDALIKAHPKLGREQAAALVRRQAIMRVVQQYYEGLLEKAEVKKDPENLAKAVEIHERLLRRPAEPRAKGQYWIKNSQVRDELSEEEKGLVLATFKGGQFTLADWFRALCDIVPPRRPTDLNTPQGVEKLLDQGLRTPILVAEAKARGYARNKELQERIREVEDQRVLWKAMSEATADLKEPNEAEIKAFYEAHKEHFAEGPVLKVDEIWFRDKAAAEKARESLDTGAEFASVKKEYSLDKDRKPHPTSPAGEGPFWKALWKADPNEVVGPVRGFYSDGVRWRVVKVIEKTPAKVQPYSEQMTDRVRSAMFAQRRAEALDSYREKLLDEYPHKIFEDRIRGMDPLEIATKEGDG